MLKNHPVPVLASWAVGVENEVLASVILYLALDELEQTRTHFIRPLLCICLIPHKAVTGKISELEEGKIEHRQFILVIKLASLRSRAI